MTGPSIRPFVGGYELSWPPVSIIVSRLHQHQDGRLTGEITVKLEDTTDNKIKTIYPPTQINFLADRTRSSLVAGLKNKIAAVNKIPIPWKDIVDQLCFKIQEIARAGEPLQEISGEGTIASRPEFLIKPFIVKNYPNILFGDPGSFKSNLAIMFASVMSLPWSGNPWGLPAPPSECSVVYLDWETDEGTVKWAQKRLIEGTPNLSLFRLHYRQCALPLSQDLEAINARLQEARNGTGRPLVVIIDSIGPASGDELNDSGPSFRFYRALRQLQATSLILGHNAKNSEGKRSLYGNQFYTAQARNIWEVRKVQEEGSTTADIALLHNKPPPFSGLAKSWGFKLSFTDDTISITQEDARDIPDFVAAMSIGMRILDFLKESPATPKEIAEGLGVKDGHVRITLMRLKKDGKVVKLDDGRYGLGYRE